MLGRLRMTIDECIEVFMRISHTVFGNPPGIMSRAIGAIVAGKPFFDAGKLEQAVKELLTARGMNENTRMDENGNAKCKVSVFTYISTSSTISLARHLGCR